QRSALNDLFMQAPAAICMLRGLEHVFELVNPGYQQLFKGRQLLGRPIREALPDFADHFEHLDRVYNTGEPYVARETRVMLDREAFFNFIYQPMYSGSGRVEGITVFGFDVTAEQRSLLAAQEMNHSKDEFLAIISHELRTPLTSILGWARMLRMGGLDGPTTEEALNALERSAQAQVHLIEDLLDDTRIASGKLRLNKRVLQIKSIIESTLADVTPAAEARRIRLIADLQNDHCPMIGDPTRLQQVVWNIVSNAIKFTPEKGNVFVTLRRKELTAEIEVRDNGRGIESDLLPQLFQRFRQGDSASSRKAGLGLGLAISKYLVEQHGGSIKASSEGRGRGATFTIELPLTIETPDEFKRREPNRAEDLADLA